MDQWATDKDGHLIGVCYGSDGNVHMSTETFEKYLAAAALARMDIDTAMFFLGESPDHNVKLSLNRANDHLREIPNAT